MMVLPVVARRRENDILIKVFNFGKKSSRFDLVTNFISGYRCIESQPAEEMVKNLFLLSFCTVRKQ